MRCLHGARRRQGRALLRDTAVLGSGEAQHRHAGRPRDARKPHPLQRAFVEEQAVQCGYCINGMIMESAALLARNKKPSEAEIKQALARNLCRCGTHVRIIRAVPALPTTPEGGGRGPDP